MYEKLEKSPIRPFRGRPMNLLIRHPSANSERIGLLRHVIGTNVDHHMLPQLPLARNLQSCDPTLLRTAGAPGHYVT